MRVRVHDLSTLEGIEAEWNESAAAFRLLRARRNPEAWEATPVGAVTPAVIRARLDDLLLEARAAGMHPADLDHVQRVFASVTFNGVPLGLLEAAKTDDEFNRLLAMMEGHLPRRSTP